MSDLKERARLALVNYMEGEESYNKIFKAVIDLKYPCYSLGKINFSRKTLENSNIEPKVVDDILSEEKLFLVDGYKAFGTKAFANEIVEKVEPQVIIDYFKDLRNWNDETIHKLMSAIKEN